MILTWRDALSTTLLGAAAATYGFYGPSILQVKPVAAGVLVLGAVTAAIEHSRLLLERPRKPTLVAGFVLATAGLVAAVTASVTGEVAALVVAAACVVALWLLALTRHMIAGRVSDRELRQFLNRQRIRDRPT
ncbi:hypothetical protein ACFQZ4_46545 [Catellatospora coxensis]|uniref:Uncharacterized protein n=1 Tax=Catellatospora coxensis TaxID=310354 RepID=A0A8J3L2R6_9ACTN|nr:hypothetical protein [Catellatospora coxensis]GIG05580.1 hypothetical protein Cco03nite_22800 [Catellatospora coxensis]